MRKPALNVCKHPRPSRASKLLLEFSPETKLRQMRKFLSSPLTKHKMTSHKTFGVPIADLVSKDPQHKVPLVVRRLCRFIETKGLRHEGIFRVAGNTKTIEGLRRAFDDKGDANLEDETDVHSVANTLKLFLRELPEPIIPNLLSRHFILAYQENKNNFESNLRHLSRLVCLLPDEHYNLLKFIIEFLTKVTQHMAHNKMNSIALGVLFGPNIFRITSGLDGLADQAISNEIITLFIENHEKIFKKENFDVFMSPHRPLSSNAAFFHLQRQGIKSLNLSSTAKALYSPSQKTDFDVAACNLAELSLSDFRTTQNRMQEAKLHNLQAKTSNKSASESKVAFRPFSFSDGAEVVYKDKNKNDKLKRSKSHSEMASLNNNDVNLNLCPFANDDNVFCFKERSPLSTNAQNEQHSAIDNQPDNKDGVSDVLTYDSDETHELKRRAERQIQIGIYAQSRSRKRSESGKHSRSSKRSSSGSREQKRFVSSARHRSTGSKPVKEEGYAKATTSGNSHVDSDSNEEQKRKLSSEFASLLASSDEQSVIPCPRTFHLRTSSYTEGMEIQLLGRATPHDVKTEAEDSSGSSNEKEGKKPKGTFLRVLKRKFQWLKRKIRIFEKKFEKERGHKPTRSEKLKDRKVKEHIDELSKVSLELKVLKESPVEVNEDLIHAPTAGKSEKFTRHPSMKETIDEIKRMLDEHRINSKRPESIENMNPQQVQSEKACLQKALLYFEGIHGRPGFIYSTPNVRALYDRYRYVKRLTTKCASPSCSQFSGSSLVPIIEDMPTDFADTPPKPSTSGSSKRSASESRAAKSESSHSSDSELSDLAIAGPSRHISGLLQFDETSVEASGGHAIRRKATPPKKFEEIYPASNINNHASLPSLAGLLALSEEEHQLNAGSRVYDQSHLVSGPGKFSDETCPVSGQSVHQLRRLSDPKKTTELSWSPATFHEMSRYDLIKVYKLATKRLNTLTEKIGNIEAETKARRIQKTKLGRKMRRKDKVSINRVYIEYRDVRAKMRLIEALLMKREKDRDMKKPSSSSP